MADVIKADTTETIQLDENGLPIDNTIVDTTATDYYNNKANEFVANRFGAGVSPTQTDPLGAARVFGGTNKPTSEQNAIGFMSRATDFLTNFTSAYDKAQAAKQLEKTTKTGLSEYQINLTKERDLRRTEREQERTTALRKEIAADPLIKAFKSKLDSMNQLTALAQKGSPAGDMALVYSFMRALDPASTVRETEYASASAATSLYGKAMNYLKKVDSGELLNDDQRKDFVNTARMLALQSAKSLQEQTLPYYENIAEAYELKKDLVREDFSKYFSGKDVEVLKNLIKDGKFSGEIIESGKTSIVKGVKGKISQEEIKWANENKNSNIPQDKAEALRILGGK